MNVVQHFSFIGFIKDEIEWIEDIVQFIYWGLENSSLYVCLEVVDWL